MLYRRIVVLTVMAVACLLTAWCHVQMRQSRNKLIADYKALPAAERADLQKTFETIAKLERGDFLAIGRGNGKTDIVLVENARKSGNGSRVEVAFKYYPTDVSGQAVQRIYSDAWEMTEIRRIVRHGDPMYPAYAAAFLEKSYPPPEGDPRH